jgi:hypothetical protein
MDAYEGMLKAIETITDEMLLSLYSKLLQDYKIVPCMADEDGKFLNVIIGGCYGGMVEDGSIHT